MRRKPLVSWRTRWQVAEYVRNSLWIVPGIWVAIAVALGLTLPTVDEHTSTTIGIHFGPGAAQGVLGAIAGGMITFTGFVFSILLLAVQFGSSQFSPRMLRRFLRDPSTKLALGVFMATFIYALLVLRVVGTGGNASFVPDNSVTTSLFLLLLSMLMFLRLISHTTQGLRVAAVLRELGRDTRKVVVKVYPDAVGASEDVVVPDPVVSGPVQTVTYEGQPSVVQSVHTAALVEAARQADAVIELVPRLGDQVDQGAPLFRVHGSHGPVDDAWLRKAVATGDERTLHQDPAFGFRLLADISAKALSPGVNDPTTSIQALDQIEVLLRMVGRRRLTSNVSRDAEGTTRFWYPAPSWEDYVSLAIDETRHFGEGSIQVSRRLRALLEDVRASVPEFRRPAIDVELALVDAGAARSFVDTVEQRSARMRDRQGLGAGRPVGDGAAPDRRLTAG